MSNSALEKIKELEREKAALAEEAKREAVALAQEAVDVLGALGVEYKLVREEKSKKTGSRRGSRKPNPKKPCPICLYQTEPPHDARHHRNQAVKQAFTDEELVGKGMKRVWPGADMEVVPEAAE